MTGKEWCVMVRDAACHATRRDGGRCGSTVVLPSGYCPMHDPDRQAEMRAARVRGGRGKARTARLARLVPSTLKPVLAQLLDALEETHSGAITPAQAGALAALAGAIVKVYTAGTMEERIAALEAQASVDVA